MSIYPSEQSSRHSDSERQKECLDDATSARASLFLLTYKAKCYRASISSSQLSPVS
jgi:hypothetical protein